MKLVMTLLVRDEQDIIGANIDFHLARGVDFVIATDNRSVDNTAAILEKYRANGKLHYVFEPRDDYNQHAWVTSMAQLAFTEYGADWVINNDADEFWWSVDGDLKESFARLPPDVNIVEAPRHNFVTLADCDEPFWRRMVYREAISLNSLGRSLPSKVAHRGSATVKVHQGNHSVEGIGSQRAAHGLVEILHFPTRSYEQIESKIAKGGAAYERNRDLPKSAGETWRVLYEEYVRHGHLRHHFAQIAYDSGRLEEALNSGAVKVDRRLADYLQAHQEASNCMDRGSNPTSTSAAPVRQPAVTFVIPVFNNERYLEQCLQSVIAQSLTETEIICVNDGSTDASGLILAKFAGLDPRLSVIDNGRNLGAGYARNRGIAAATGRFIRFVDADDLLPRESTEQLYRRAVATDSDLVRGGLAVFRRDDASDPEPMIEHSDRISTLREEPSLWIPYWHTSYLMARSLLLDHKLCYPGLRRGEDPLFMASVLVHARQIAHLAENVYLYRRYTKKTGAAGTSYADVTDTLVSAMSIKSLFIEKCPECWHQGYAPFLLEDFRKFIARCPLDEAQRKFVAASAKALWGEVDLEPITTNHAAAMVDVTAEQETCPEVSVVVPVYNKAPYLAACLESVLAQTLPSLELICVDDGSTDGSREILDLFAKRDPRVKVICHDRNRGAAAARNLGLDAAKGEFVQFTDADDLLEPDALRLLITAARADTVPIVRGGIVGFRSATPEGQVNLDLPEARSGVRPLGDESTWSPWWHTTYLFSRRLLVSEGIRYPDLCSGEDPVFLARVLSCAPAISTLSTVVYRHRLMPLGEKGRTTFGHLRDYLRHAEMTRDLFLQVNGEAWHRGFAPLLLPEIRSMIDGWQMSDHERQTATAEMQRIFALPRPPGNAARRRVLFMYRVCGLGGVETSIINKMEALGARGIEARAVFESSWGEGGQVLARHPGFAIAADEEAQKRLILDWAPDAISVVDTPKFVDVIRNAGVRCSVLFETHMSEIEAFKKRRILDGITSSLVSKVVVPSTFNRDTLVAHGVDPQRVRVIANAIDTRRFSAKAQPDIRSRLGLPKDRRLVLFVGRLEPQKNPLEFVRVCATLLDRGVDIHAVVVGDSVGTWDFAAAVHAEAAALREHVTFIPRIPYEEMPWVYAAATMSGGCLISTSLHESQPMILLEAMACACPVVASDVGGVREILRDGATGHHYPLGDTSKAAAAALLLMHDEDHRAAIVNAALRHVEERHGPAGAAEAYLALLDEVGTADQRNASPTRAEQGSDVRQASASRLSPAGEPEHWDRFFAKRDPWNYSSDYEQQKYRHTLELLPPRSFPRAAEVGCAEGMFTELLAPRVERLVAADISAAALERARGRCAALAHVEFVQHDISAGMPGDAYDLVVCSEILYYLRDRAAVERCVGEIHRALRPGGYVLTTHSTMVSDDRSATGFDFNEIGAATIGEIFSRQPGLDFERELRTELYRVQLFRRTEAAMPAAASVARSPGTPRETLVRANAKFEGSVVKRGGCVVTAAEANHCWLTDDLPVLMYHRVADDGPSALAPYRVSCAAFERQLAWLQRYGYHGLTLEQACQARFERKLRAIPGKAIVLTFDDAYTDFYENAWPLLRHYGFAATVFVPTDHVGRDATWDSAHGAPAPIMSWDQISVLSAAGVQFGSHSCCHRRMTELTPSEVLDDAMRSRAEITDRLGAPVRAYCYPFGAANSGVVDMIKRAGYQYAVRGLRHEQAQGDDPLQIPRVDVIGSDTIEEFVARLPAPKLASDEQRARYAELRSRRDRATYMDR